MTSHMQHGKNEYSEVSHLQYDKKLTNMCSFSLEMSVCFSLTWSEWTVLCFKELYDRV